jgi:4-amino-4-deoxy-L-arabinose transferase-like glycosyltransferase
MKSVNKYKVYFQLVAAMLVIAGIAGFAAPALLSAKSTIAVALGILLLVASGAFLLFFPSYFLNQFKKDEPTNV